MLVPEAAMNEDDLPQTRQHEVRLARKIFAMKSKTVAKPMHKRADCDLRLCVFAADSAHIFAARFAAWIVHVFELEI